MSALDRTIKLLIVEDSEDDLLLMMREIKRAGYQASCKRIETETDMRRTLAEEEWDLIIADFTMPRFSGLAALHVLNTTGLDIPLIIVSGTITDETAVAAMKAGAKDYLMKDNLARLVPVLEREITESRERAEKRRIQETLKKREAEEQRAKQEAEAAARKFMCDTIYAVTDGKLRLIGYREARQLTPSTDTAIEIDSPQKLSEIRAKTAAAATRMHITDDRTHALVSAVEEASVNALKHAERGTLTIHSMQDRIRISIRDRGEGIESLILPSATLMSRFSTKRSMGFGFALMLTLVDIVYLATGPRGTWIILEQAVNTTPPPELTLSQLPDVW